MIERTRTMAHPSLRTTPTKLWTTACRCVMVPATIGLFLLIPRFTVGLEPNAGLVRERAHAAIAISHASIVAPFLAGLLLSISLYPRLSSSDGPPPNFTLFSIVAMSSTASPVLARVLTDQQTTEYTGVHTIFGPFHPGCRDSSRWRPHGCLQRELARSSSRGPVACLLCLH
jgi:hypothetical protein